MTPSKPVRQIYKKDLEEWPIPDDLKALVIRKLYDIIEDPSTSERARGIAIRNLTVINGQNIQTRDSQPAQKIEIKIIEDDPKSTTNDPNN